MENESNHLNWRKPWDNIRSEPANGLRAMFVTKDGTFITGTFESELGCFYGADNLHYGAGDISAYIPLAEFLATLP